MNDSSAKTADAPLDMIQNFASINTLLASIPALDRFGARTSSEVLQRALWNEGTGGPLLETYKAALREFWDKPAPATGSDHLGSAHEVLAQLFRDGALAELQWLKATRKITWEQAGNLTKMLEDTGAGIARRVTTSISKYVVYLPFDVLVDPAGTGNAGYAVWLLPHGGQLAKFPDERTLLKHLSSLFLKLDQRQAILAMLPPAEQTRVEAQLRTTEGLQLSLSTMAGGLFTSRVKGLRTSQDTQLFGLNRELSLISDPAARQGRIEHIRSLGGLDVAQSNWMEALLAKIRREQVPEWLRSAAKDDASLFATRGKQQAACLQRVDEAVAPLSSYLSFAHAYLTDQLTGLGIAVDPARVEVNLSDAFIVDGRECAYQRKKSLMALELSDLYGHDESRTTIRLTDADQAAGLTEGVVRSLVQSKDLRVAYPQELSACYSSAPVNNALVDLQDARIASSLVAAKMQGVFSAQTFELLDGLREPYVALHKFAVATYSVALANGGFQLADALVLSVQDQGETVFLLYAPNSPAGQDWLEHRNQQQVLDTIIGWTGTLEGRSYLLGQVPFMARAGLVPHLDMMAATPHLITRTSVQLTHSRHARWRDLLASMVGRQTSRILDETKVLTPSWYIDAGLKARRKMVRLDCEISLVTQMYRAATQISTFGEFTRERLQHAFDNDPSRSHDSRRWNVGKFEIKLAGQWRSLVWLAMNGVERGTDVSKLPVKAHVDASLNDREIVSDLMARFLSKNDAPNDYEALLESTLLDPSAPGRDFRNTLFLKLSQLELDRARMQLALDPQAREGIHPQSMVLPGQGTINLSLEKGSIPYHTKESGIYHLKIKGEKVRGVYLFRDLVNNAPVDVVYTPHAPDGIWFRPVDDIAGAIEHNGLGTYLRERVPFKHLARFDRFLQKLEAAGYSSAFTREDERVGAYEMVRSFPREHDAMIRSILTDVDASTTSKVERFTTMIVARTIQVLGVVTLPFPPARMALGVAKVLMSLYQAAEAYRTADRAQAAWHLLDAALGVASLAGVSGKPQEKFLEALFKGPPPDLAEKMISKFSDRLTDELDTYLRSITIPKKGEAPTQTWLQPPA